MPESPPPVRHTVVELVAPYRDTRAEDLCWSLTLPVQPALAVRTVRLAGFVLELRLLGASHQVLLWTEQNGELRCVETVACLPGLAAPMPEGAASPLAEGYYEFASRIVVLEPARFALAAERIRRDCVRNGASLVGAYPGAPDALTAILPEPDGAGVRWTTWHSYPQNGRLVRTNGAFRRTLAPKQGGSALGDQGEGLDGVRSYGAGPPPVAVVSCHRP
ncbi:DUF2617 family protein [Actinospica durhamensis]|uniref:DUF2617 family protein n=1 Tax=Actinospica durhamensis TaxID=1508375 RepID=A0A941EPL6_9ACTN|nr:DUF2617 family protein [Actinospica durhamensis]MBR7834970.1 DUF2617 family protein [Actinospica durhamensis]